MEKSMPSQPDTQSEAEILQRMAADKRRFDENEAFWGKLKDAMGEYLRIFPPSDKAKKFWWDFSTSMELWFSRFFDKKTIRRYLPGNEAYNLVVPMTLQDFRQQMNDMIEVEVLELARLKSQPANIDRFVFACDVACRLIQKIGNAAAIFLFADQLSMALELLAEYQNRDGRFFSRDEQDRMISAFDGLIRTFNQLAACLGIRVDESLVEDVEKKVEERFSILRDPDYKFRMLFEGDRDHADFNPHFILWACSVVRALARGWDSEDNEFTYVKDAFNQDVLHLQGIALSTCACDFYDNARQGQANMDRVNTRIRILLTYLGGTLKKGWTELCADDDQASVENVQEKRKKLLAAFESAGWKIEDVLNGEVVTDDGRRVKIRVSQTPPVIDVEKGLAAGTRIGDFRVIAPIGAGEMGSVYEVEYAELCGAHLALKFFNPKSGDPDGRLLERFKREIQILLAISNIKEPNVRLLSLMGSPSLERTEYPPYYVMSYVVGPDGKPCTLLKAKERFCDEYTLEMAERWFEDLCCSLAALHKKGILHRDIKPENILIDKDLHAVLSDFGISKAEDGKAAGIGSTDLTIVGKFEREQVGTPRYWAPELAEGGEATPASDIYALGVTFWHLLFDSEVSPSNYPPDKEAFEDFGEGWYAVMTAMLNPNPKLREQSAAHCVELLRPKKEQVRFSFKWTKTKVACLVAALAAAVIGGILIFGRPSHRDKARPTDFGSVDYSELYWPGHYSLLRAVGGPLLVCESIPRAFAGTQAEGTYQDVECAVLLKFSVGLEAYSNLTSRLKARLEETFKLKGVDSDVEAEIDDGRVEGDISSNGETEIIMKGFNGECGGAFHGLVRNVEMAKTPPKGKSVLSIIEPKKDEFGLVVYGARSYDLTEASEKWLKGWMSSWSKETATLMFEGQDLRETMVFMHTHDRFKLTGRKFGIPELMRCEESGSGRTHYTLTPWIDEGKAESYYLWVPFGMQSAEFEKLEKVVVKEIGAHEL